MRLLERRNHHRNDAVDGLRCYLSAFQRKRSFDLIHLLDNSETIRVVSVEDIRAHECEDWHDIVEDGIGCHACKASHE